MQRPTSKPRKSSNLRKSFAPSPANDEEETEASGVVTPKRSGLSRIAIQRNASKRASLLASSLPSRQEDDAEDRPSYCASALQELKESTPTTPYDPTTTDGSISDVNDVASSTQALDLSSKFGSSLARYQQPSAIPSATEIAEKKARRSRLAKEKQAEDYISLDPDDPNLDNEDDDDNVTRDLDGRLVLKPKDKYGQSESRLVADDEDVMENFEDFTEDGKMALGRKAEVEAARRRKDEMAAQIAQAEGADDEDDDSDTSERERNMAFEAAQTRHGAYATHATSEDPYEHLRPKTPPIISPLPTLDGVIERLRKQLSEMQAGQMQKLQEMEALRREKIRLGEEEVRIQRALRETAEKFQQLRAERGIPAANEGTPALETVGAMAMLENGDETDYVNEDVNGGHAGLGFGRGLDSVGASGLGTPRDVESEEYGSVQSEAMAA